MSRYIMAIDQGTTGTTCLLVRPSGKVKGSVNVPFEQIYPQPGWVEHSPEAILNSVKKAIVLCLEKVGASGHDIISIGITNQRETLVAWDRQSSQSLHNAIVWQCRRTSKYCEKNKSHEPWIKKKTGLVLDPYFSGTKARWMIKNVDEVKKKNKEGNLCLGTIDSYLLWSLSGGVQHKTDVSNASRTLLMNLSNLKYDSELLEFFKINEKSLPEICASNEKFGVTKSFSGLPDGIPITGIVGDQQSALFGQTGFNKGAAKITFGTGSFMLFNTGKDIKTSKKGLLSTAAWRLKGRAASYALEGGAFACGAAVQWLRDGLGIIERSSEVETLALQVSSSEGVDFVPAFVGLGAPHWKAEARGTLCGLTRGTTKSHIAYATLESMAFQNLDIFEIMEKESGLKSSMIRVDGGACQNNLLMQMQANFLQRNLQRPKALESTSLGAAFMSGLGSGVWSSLKELSGLNPVQETFKSKYTLTELKQRRKQWRKALERSLIV